MISWEEQERALLAAAKKARSNAYAPYSKFAVGAAVLTDDGEIFSGCNIENASYGLSNCAERTAIFSMVASGKRHIAAVAVIADTPRAVSPCGACRQVLAEFGRPETPVVLANQNGHLVHTTLKELLPYAFHREDLTTDD